MKIMRKRITELMNLSMSEEGVYRTAPATQGLLKSLREGLKNH